MIDEMRQDIEHRISPLIGGIAEDLSTLMRQELALAKSELRVQVQTAVSAALQIGGAALFLIIGVMFICTGGILLLLQSASGIPAWAIFCGGGIFLLLPALLLFVNARRQIETISIVPERTLNSLQGEIE